MIRSRKDLLAAAICLAMGTALFAQIRASKPEIPYADDVPLTPNVRPVLVVSGSDYEMGYQWYQQIVQIYGTIPLEERAHRNFNKEELEALKATQWYIRKYTPEMLDLVKGMVDGAKAGGVELSYEEVLAKWAGHAYIVAPANHAAKVPAESRAEKLPCCDKENDCTGFAAWGTATKDGKLICGGSGDHELMLLDNEIHDFEYCLVVLPKSGNNFVLSTSTGCCWHPGMNNKGVAMFHHGATGYCGRYKSDKEADYGYGVPNVMITMHTLRFANTASEAQEMILSLPSGDGRIGGAWADVGGNAFVIENRDNPRSIRKPGDNGEKDFIYATNNLFAKELGSCYKASPGLPVEFIPHAGWLGTSASRESIPRNLEIWNLLHNYHGKVDLEFAKMMWRFPAEPPRYSTLEEADADFDRTQGRNWNSHISETGNAMVGILAPDKGDKGKYFVSQGCAARINHPHWPYLRLYRIAPTYTFYELQLTSSAQKVVDAARDRAMYDMSYANQELRKLTYQDTAYAPLDDIFNQAATEWQKGQYYQSRADRVKGNENVMLLGKSVRAFTRCQALAKQVFESLIPPPGRPEDLGLRPWLGPWGEWAVRSSKPSDQSQP